MKCPGPVGGFAQEIGQGEGTQHRNQRSGLHALECNIGPVSGPEPVAKGQILPREQAGGH